MASSPLHSSTTTDVNSPLSTSADALFTTSDVDVIRAPVQNALQEIFDNAKKYADIAEKRSVFYHDIEKALDMVRDFIIQKNRIIYGGMAIDLSLKLSGHAGIYAADAIPDYDFMSPDFYNDSNELADLFAKTGFTNISAINAMHITTRRVRINFIPVADITYIPPTIYDTLPTLMFGKMRVIHPDYQRLDMHRAFCIPYENPPQEVFMSRARKDQKRYHLLTTAYPLSMPATESAHVAKLLPISLPSGMRLCIGGLCAYGIYYTIYKALYASISDDIKKTLDISPEQLQLVAMDTTCVDGEIQISWAYELQSYDDKLDILSIDKPIPLINLISDAPNELVKAIDTTFSATYYPYLDDFRPHTQILWSAGLAKPVIYEIYDNAGKLLPAWPLNAVLQFWKLGSASKPISLASVQYVLLYFLLKSFECPKLKEFYLQYYCSTEKMVIAAEKIVKYGMEKLYAKIPFFLTPNTFGTTNVSPTYLAYIKEKMAMLIGETIPSERPIFGYYPDLELPGSWPKFDAAATFHTDGRKISTIEHKKIE